MELTKYKEYQIGKLPDKITEFNNSLAKIKDKDEITKTKSLILLILGRYLSLNVKGKSITDAFALEMIIEDIFVNYSFLTVQEIEFILKNGIMGKYGLIYNDISIDTLMGVGGWFDTYDKTFIKSKVAKSEPKIYSGKEKPMAEWYEIYPDLKIVSKCRDMTLELEDVKWWYKLKGLGLDKYKQDCEMYSKSFFKIDEELREKGKLSEMGYILNNHRDFILNYRG